MTKQKSVGTLIGELRELVVDYARQETVDPLRRIARGIGYGIVGAFFMGLGIILLALAGLRALQTETSGRFDDELSWAPYGIVVLALLALIPLTWLVWDRGRR